MKRFSPVLSFAAVLSFSALCAFSAQAEETRSFVVTASRVAEDAFEAPAQVAVVTSEDIAASGASNVLEALKSLAGIDIRSYSSNAQAEISMRGFGENSHGRVLVLMDGRRLNNPDMQTIDWLSVPLADVERIEVLQGSSSVRYGNNAVGGVVNIITKKAKKGTATSTGLSAGSFGENREQFSVNVGGENGGFVASAEHFSTDGYRERTGYRSADASIRGHLDLNDTLTLKAGVSLSDVFYEMPGGLSKTQYAANAAKALNYEDEARGKTYLAELGAEWNPDETISIDIPLSYSYKNIKSEMPSYYNAVWMTPEQHTDRAAHSLQAAPVASWDGGIASLPLRVVLGTDVAAAFLGVNTYSERARTARINAFDVSQISVGPYLTARLSILEALSVEGGARYDRSVIAAKNASGSVDASKTHQAFVYDAGLTYRPAKNAKIYARYGSLFRYPFTDEQTSLYGFGTDSFLTELEAEKGFNAEAGFSVSFGRLAWIDACAYWMELTDEIAYNSATYKNENLDKTRRLGGDLSITLKPVSFVSLKGTYGYVNATFASGANDGKRVPLVPEQKAEAEIIIEIPFGLSVAPSATYRSDSYQGGDNSNSGDKIDSYTVYALTVRFAPHALKGMLEFTAKAENVLDLKYAPYIYYGAYYPAAGRSFRLGASYRY